MLTIRSYFTSKYKIVPKNLITALKQISKKSRKKIFLLTFFQCTLGLLEIISLYLLTVVVSFGFESVTGAVNNSKLMTNFPFINKVSPNNRAIMVAFILVFITSFKSAFSAYLNLTTLKVLATETAGVSERIFRNLIINNFQIIRFKDSQNLLGSLTYGVEALILTQLGALISIISDGLSFIIILGSLYYFDIYSGLLISIILFLSAKIFNRYTSKKVGKLSRELVEFGIQINRLTLDILGIYRELLLSNKKAAVLDSVSKKRLKVTKKRAELAFIPNISKYLLETFSLFVCLLIAVVQFVFYDAIHAITSFALVLAAFSRILPNALRLQTNYQTILASAGASTLTSNLLDSFKGNKNSNNFDFDSKAFQFNPKIVVRNLTYSFPESLTTAVKDITFDIEPGQFVAIVGPSGSGKSTLIDLILGLLEPQNGCVLISGVDSKQLIQLVPGKIAYVPQNVAIIQATIGQNISLCFNQDYDENSVLLALNQVGLVEEISLFPDGIHTLLGESGIRLSGGQKQRIGIARALYTDPEIIFLDEATSSLDSKMEFELANLVYLHNKRITTVVVAHRLSTVASADKVIYMENGQIKAQGNFAQVRSAVPDFDKQAQLSGL